LLEQAGLEFEVRPAEGAEGPRLDGESPAEYARRRAEQKALVVSGSIPEALVLGADTVVTLDDRGVTGRIWMGAAYDSLRPAPAHRYGP